MPEDISKALNIVREIEAGGAHVLERYVVDDPEMVERFRLLATILHPLYRYGDETVEGSIEEGSITYATPEGLVEVMIAFPGGPTAPEGPATLTQELAERFRPLVEKEEETGDDAWRDGLDDEEGIALAIYEQGGQTGQEYFLMGDGDVLLADTFYEQLSDALARTCPYQFWKDMTNSDLREWAEELGHEEVPTQEVHMYANIVRETLEDPRWSS